MDAAMILVLIVVLVAVLATLDRQEEVRQPAVCKVRSAGRERILESRRIRAQGHRPPVPVLPSRAAKRGLWPVHQTRRGGPTRGRTALLCFPVKGRME